LMFTSLL